ncbi:MAG: hypothetical protein O2846_04260 [Proteobacteria bacterium]|uniref:Uncharacterized protein n=1 Tax=SAR86 cluster bacterium TaxID=2030880 RepID=A0A937I4X3_9GAMM|nr:hypothetical protein [SAR86 cluster bacterium]MDA0775566.1 hypothetical protein [Pseudomonadota bacterium]MDA0976756.1 hypothetical protein [Pseudomonadota bacterium]MDA1037949.1 hypothetical protein [Pseudomonadota bacterium]NCX10943.1 hypothetical protein [Pseudomonadota bacterium]
MEYIVIFAALAFLIGSISFAIPSKSSRNLSKLRLESNKLGFKISSSSVGTNSFKNKNFNRMIYKIKNETNLKEAHFIRDKDELILYSPLKLKYSDSYDEIQKKVKNLPLSIDELVFSSSSISFIWKENMGLDELKKINNLLKVF